MFCCCDGPQSMSRTAGQATVLARLTEVFGPLGGLHFLLPALPVREPRLEPAYRRLLGPQFT